MNGRRALLIVNRHSRTGRADLSATRSVLEQHGLKVIEHPLDRPDDIPGTIRCLAGEVDLVIVAGGDGSMNAAAYALLV